MPNDPTGHDANLDAETEWGTGFAEEGDTRNRDVLDPGFLRSAVRKLDEVCAAGLGISLRTATIIKPQPATIELQGYLTGKAGARILANGEFDAEVERVFPYNDTENPTDASNV